MAQKERLDFERIGRSIDEQRKSKGWTLEEFAEKAFVDVRTINRWIKNGVNKIDLILDIADLFGVTLEDIIFPKGE